MNAPWQQDAVIYEVRLHAFCDGDGDGVGDFQGLEQRLDYIAALGANTIWLLPFYPSPGRDDGYDVADYTAVAPQYGTLDDARLCIDAAHARGIKVITELVLNHTSDQHPWFQAARHAPAGSAARAIYVWSDTPSRYAGTRTIFLDTEPCNWTWDSVAGAYYWHRFFAHQPDLNYDNPAVLDAMLAAARFWLDIGVDGLRLDAAPYLIEREGTANANLPETHAILRRIRAETDRYTPPRVLLAEANLPPAATVQYFGAGDECQMAFQFPLMPRLFLAAAREDAAPILDIMHQMPPIPAGCQWATFLRNHDELSLEMVDAAERQAMLDAYAPDAASQLNLGIRRRLAPLLGHDKRRIMLMNSLLLSMPGAPVIYYGDEIGMGDDVALPDRDGLRLPMPWSTATQGSQPTTVALQEADAGSLLHAMRHLVAARAACPALARGGQRFLPHDNRHVLAFLRHGTADDAIILCVANLAGTAQTVALNLSEFAGRPVHDAIGIDACAPVGIGAYRIDLPAHGFAWRRLGAIIAEPSGGVPA